MKFYIKPENRWTTLSACVDNHVFYQYMKSWYLYHGRMSFSWFDDVQSTFITKGNYYLSEN